MTLKQVYGIAKPVRFRQILPIQRSDWRCLAHSFKVRDCPGARRFCDCIL